MNNIFSLDVANLYVLTFISIRSHFDTYESAIQYINSAGIDWVAEFSQGRTPEQVAKSILN